MGTYLTNRIIKFETRENTMSDIEKSGVTETYVYQDYTSKNWEEIKSWIDSLDSDFFDYYQLQNNPSIEAVAYDIYGIADFWDIIMIINDRNPLFDLPYDYDTLTEFVESKIEKFKEKIYGDTLSENAYNAMYESYKNEYIENAETLRVIKIIKVSRIQEFLLLGKTKGYFV